MLNYSINKGALVLALMLLLSAHSVKADTLSVAITEGACIFNADSTQSRLLLKFELPTELTGSELTFAELFVPLTAAIPDSSALAVECHPLVISWEPAQIAWNDLGDSLSSEVIAEQNSQFATATEGAQEAYFDLTEIIRSWQDSSLANNGLLLFYDTASQPYFTYSRGEGAPFGTIRFDYTH